MATSLAGKHILITGASKGLGRSLARKIHEAGAILSLTARSLGELESLKQELGSRALVYAADLTKRDECDNMLAYFRKHSGPFYGLINNAGAGTYKPFADFSTQENDLIMDVNLNSLVYLTHLVIPDMKAGGSGSIINIASDLGRRPLANMALYSAAKFGVVGFSQSLTRELKQHNIRVMVMTPGLIDTHFGGRNPGDIKPPVALDPDDMAEVVVFMLTRPDYVIMDEVSIHPRDQDF
jgi:3-oxoacyl-[acyl-carrier protein] reductase